MDSGGPGDRQGEAKKFLLFLPRLFRPNLTHALPHTVALPQAPQQKPQNVKTALLQIIRKIKDQAWSWPYVCAVDKNDAPGYYDVIKNPIDLQTMEQRVRKGTHYNSKMALKNDILLMTQNCKTFNPYDPNAENPYWDTAVALEQFLVRNEFLFMETV